ncbi:MAG: hypothetical protein CVV22_06360 [Ignavibacteriae bacterium HGW-Ignavibacteriae-1]|nr:MAG: hypothetical protein CVV22_06360 [Ignavibacteriae bacterium HGW-Ignavibacteriae-1]
MTIKSWNKKPKLIKPTEAISNFSHNKCYAQKTINCSTKISREHYFSNNILKNLEVNNKVKIIGLPWQEKETFNLIPKSNLVSNILCTTHNTLLSPFDDEMGRFHRIIIKFDEDFNLDNPKNDLSVFCGEDLEKWMLKTACNFIASNQIYRGGVKSNYMLKDEYIDILFNDKPFPENWGMYFKIPENKPIQKFKSISFRSITGNNELQAVEFLINNFKFYLVLCQPANPSLFGKYRPRGMQFYEGDIKKTIEICWQDEKYNEGIFLERKGTARGEPKEWDDYLKK